jgi:hypothetical protein
MIFLCVFLMNRQFQLLIYARRGGVVYRNHETNDRHTVGLTSAHDNFTTIRTDIADRPPPLIPYHSGLSQRGGGGGGGGRLATRIFFIYMHESLAFSQSVIDTYCVYPLPPAGQFSNVTETVKFTYKHKSKLISKYWKPPDISPRV